MCIHTYIHTYIYIYIYMHPPVGGRGLVGHEEAPAPELQPARAAGEGEEGQASQRGPEGGDAIQPINNHKMLLSYSLSLSLFMHIHIYIYIYIYIYTHQRGNCAGRPALRCSAPRSSCWASGSSRRGV